MSLSSDSNLGALTDREILLRVYDRVDAIAKRGDDHETRLRVLEAHRNQTLGLVATGGGSGAIAGGVVVAALRLLGGF